MMYEEDQEDAFMAQNESLEAELLSSRNSLGASLGQSLAFELQSATFPEASKSTQSQRGGKSNSPTTVPAATTTIANGKEFGSLADDKGAPPAEIELELNGVKMEGFGIKQAQLPIGVSHSLADEMFTHSNAPSPSPSLSVRSQHLNGTSGLDETTESLAQPRGDTVEFFKIQLDNLTAAVTETKTLHKRIIDSLLSDENLQLSRAADSSSFAPPLELVISAVARLMDRNARDRERHLTILRSIEKIIRVEGLWLPSEVLDDVDELFVSIAEAMTDPDMTYANPVPTIHQLRVDSSSLSDTLEDMKEQMYVHKKQGQELLTRMRGIAKAVHEVRKELRELSEQAGSSDEEDVVVLQEGEVQTRVRDILGGLDELDQRSSKEIQRMMGWWRGDGSTAVGVAS